MDFENTIIKHTFRYLIARDILFLLLVFIHTLIFYKLIEFIKVPIIVLLGAGLLTSGLCFCNLMLTVYRTRKDSYLKQAFKDEFFISMRIKSGYHGYIAVIVTSIFFIVTSLLMDMLSTGIDIPIYLILELVILIGVVTDDMSKILQSRG